MKIDQEGYEFIRDRIKTNIISMKLEIEDFNSEALIVKLAPFLDDIEEVIEDMKNSDMGWSIRSQEDAFDN